MVHLNPHLNTDSRDTLEINCRFHISLVFQAILISKSNPLAKKIKANLLILGR